jgi:hypothetical protein
MPRRGRVAELMNERAEPQMAGKFVKKTVEDQRREHDRLLRLSMVSLNLELELNSLMRDILGGDTSKLVRFQQYLQYAPEPTRERLLSALESKREK